MEFIQLKSSRAQHCAPNQVFRDQGSALIHRPKQSPICNRLCPNNNAGPYNTWCRAFHLRKDKTILVSMFVMIIWFRFQASSFWRYFTHQHKVLYLYLIVVICRVIVCSSRRHHPLQSNQLANSYRFQIGINLHEYRVIEYIYCVSYERIMYKNIK